MSLRPLLQKFAEGFMVSGIYLQTPQELFPIVHERLDSLLILKRHPELPEGISEIKYEEKTIGILVDPLDGDFKIIILSESKNIQEVAAHWKRFSPVIRSRFQMEEFAQKESIEMRLVNRLEEIRISFEKITEKIKENISIDPFK